MKKFNRLFLLTFLFYLLSSSLLFLVSYKEEDPSLDYKVEINRFMKQLEAGNRDISTYSYLKKLSFLNIEDMNREKISSFFTEEESARIRPWYEGDTLKGYVKIYYENTPTSPWKSIFLVEIFLLCFFLFIIGLLIYLKRNIIRPFHTIASLPKELASGHFKGEIKVEKSGYFKDFLWGISSLKDDLEVSRQKELYLLRERQETLLSLSHDIKTPLNTIVLYGKALEEGLYETEKEKREAYRQISVKSTEIERYIEEITKSSREELLDLPVQMSEFYVRDLMDRILNIYIEKCQYHHIDFQVSSYPNRLLKGDLHRSQEVLENILENALKYGDGKKIWITFSEEEYCTLIHIHNTGPIVSENEWNHLFDSFFRGMSAEGKKGSGLGLYICRCLMQKMEGSIYAQKEEDGMCFVVVFK